MPERYEMKFHVAYRYTSLLTFTSAEPSTTLPSLRVYGSGKPAAHETGRTTPGPSFVVGADGKTSDDREE